MFFIFFQGCVCFCETNPMLICMTVSILLMDVRINITLVLNYLTVSNLPLVLFFVFFFFFLVFCFIQQGRFLHFWSLWALSVHFQGWYFYTLSNYFISNLPIGEQVRYSILDDKFDLNFRLLISCLYYKGETDKNNVIKD